MSEALVAALTRERWEHVNRELIAKLLTELAFEDVLAPRCEELADGRRASSSRSASGSCCTTPAIAARSATGASRPTRCAPG